MRNVLFATTALIALAVIPMSAEARANCNGRNNCNDNSTVNQGGAGGTGIGVGIGVGVGHAESNANAAAASSSRSSATVRNQNTNVGINAQEQGQLQGQLQGQQQGINSAIGATGTGNTTSTSVSVEGDTYNAPDIPVASAIAPDTMHTAVCVVGASGGLQTSGFGISLGSGYFDEFCQKLEVVRYGLASNNATLQDAAAQLYLSVISEFIDLGGNEPVASSGPMVQTASSSDWCDRFAPASEGGQFASAPSDWYDRCR